MSLDFLGFESLRVYCQELGLSFREAFCVVFDFRALLKKINCVAFKAYVEVAGKKCQGVYPSLDDRTRLIYKCIMYILCLHRLRGRWIRLPDLLLASKWIQLLDPLLALRCIKN